MADALEDSLESGVDLALRETLLPLRVFPQQYPYGYHK